MGVREIIPEGNEGSTVNGGQGGQGDQSGGPGGGHGGGHGGGEGQDDGGDKGRRDSGNGDAEEQAGGVGKQGGWLGDLIGRGGKPTEYEDAGTIEMVELGKTERQGKTSAEDAPAGGGSEEV
jgi:hypothetical protein